MTIATTLTVREIMTRDLIEVKVTDTVTRAIKLMTDNDIGSIIVTENGKPVGILTERDIMRRVCPEKLCTKHITAGEIMKRHLVHINADAGVGQASSLMALKNVRRLLVVDNREIIGIITQKDVMRGALETFMQLASI